MWRICDFSPDVCVGTLVFHSDVHVRVKTLVNSVCVCCVRVHVHLCVCMIQLRLSHTHCLQMKVVPMCL